MQKFLEVLERLNKNVGLLQELDDEDEMFAVANVASNAYRAEQQEDTTKRQYSFWSSVLKRGTTHALKGKPTDPNESWEELRFLGGKFRHISAKLARI